MDVECFQGPMGLQGPIGPVGVVGPNFLKFKTINQSNSTFTPINPTNYYTSNTNEYFITTNTPLTINSVLQIYFVNGTTLIPMSNDYLGTYFNAYFSPSLSQIVINTSFPSTTYGSTVTNTVYNAIQSGNYTFVVLYV